MSFIMFSRECAREGCNTWQRAISPAENHWVDAILNHPTRTRAIAFCTIDCMMHWAAANSEPTITTGE